MHKTKCEDLANCWSCGFTCLATLLLFLVARLQVGLLHVVRGAVFCMLVLCRTNLAFVAFVAGVCCMEVWRALLIMQECHACSRDPGTSCLISVYYKLYLWKAFPH
jgi:hypothetical protein